MDKKSNSSKITVLQSWRALFILMIFIEHTGLKKPFEYFAAGGEGVSYFLILSGFLTGYIYIDRVNDFSIKTQKDFLLKKLNKFYPLHLFALMMSFLLTILVCIKNSGFDFKQIGEIFLKTVLNAVFLQVYIPIEGWYMNSINGVAWFLSMIVYCYALSVLAIKLIKKCKDTKSLCALLFAVWALHITIVFIFKDSSLKTFMLYVFPPVRFLEYFVGMILGYFVKHKNIVIKNNICATILELLAITLFCTQHILKVGGWWQLHSGYIYISMLLVSSMIVVVFSQQRGYISSILDNNILIYFGNISFEIYIMHQVIIKYVTTVFGWNLKSAVISFIVVVAFAVIMNGYVNRWLEEKKSKRLK